MTDPDLLGGLLFIAFFVLSIVIVVLGVSLWFRLSDSAGLPQGRIPLPVTVLALGCVFLVGLVSIRVPFLALLPTAAFGVKGLRLLNHGGALNRDGGIVGLLVGIDWLLLTAIQSSLLAWEKTIAGAPIRLDIFLTLPLAGTVAILGWILLNRLPVDPDWKPRREAMSLLGMP